MPRGAPKAPGTGRLRIVAAVAAILARKGRLQAAKAPALASWACQRPIASSAGDGVLGARGSGSAVGGTGGAGGAAGGGTANGTRHYN